MGGWDEMNGWCEMDAWNDVVREMGFWVVTDFGWKQVVGPKGLVGLKLVVG